MFSRARRDRQPGWEGFVVDRERDLAWIRLDGAADGGETRLWAVGDGDIQIVTQGPTLAGIAFTQASRMLPPALLIPGAAEGLTAVVDPVRDLMAFTLLADRPHGRLVATPFTFLSDSLRGQVLTEGNGMIYGLVFHRASQLLDVSRTPWPDNAWQRRRLKFRRGLWQLWRRVTGQT